ncbi:MAG: hypothetical protein JWL83_2490 [Actinomycetia bacterium]|nr:hypothetical protein [Actinomycetes bacterium]
MSFHGSITNIERLPESNERIARIIERPDALDESAEWVVEIRAMGTHWNSRSRLAEFDRDALRFAYQSMSETRTPSRPRGARRAAPDCEAVNGTTSRC